MVLNKPVYIGFAILEVSKTLMYDFHYNYIKIKYQNDTKLLFTGTDSLCDWIKTKDLYKDIEKDYDMFDFSDYPKMNPLFNEKNKKVIGKMKDETNG